MSFRIKAIPLPEKGITALVIANPRVGLQEKPSDSITRFVNFIINSRTKFGANIVIFLGEIVNQKLPQHSTILNAIIQRIAVLPLNFYIINSPDINDFKTLNYLSRKFILCNETCIQISNRIGRVLISLNFGQPLETSEMEEIKLVKKIKAKFVPEDDTRTWALFGGTKTSIFVRELKVASVGECSIDKSPRSFGVVRIDENFSFEMKCVI
ncbi:hypothetical protein TRFO_22921 [Tritrichomonas foetus]|uniref:Uncharacterized protein n=1 Tax=Tritrichomonas foetus TaxID=1144522 RepID=A0A1J4KBB0_9EUKA|nr:hypothetical protein TRFO_22921 [Tritrichomonas foetus]|eukprot:OHT08507.1 hypothetical protein TRFO_22921 [Tritrichomonas foetus]